MTKLIIKFGLLLLLINSSITTSFAEEGDVRYYDVELIIFENTTPKYIQSEYWKKNFTQVTPETFILIGQPLPMTLPEEYDPLLSFQYVNSSDYRLTDIVTSLNESNRHRVLLHSAWRQPGLSKDEAISVRIDHFIPNENSDNELNIQDDQATRIDNEQLNNNENDLVTDVTEKSKGYVLSGYIKLILSRYLHLKIDLIYHELKQESTELFIGEEFGEDDLLPDVFHILQQRRLRSKELHYIDHPVISIVTLITPYKVKNN